MTRWWEPIELGEKALRVRLAELTVWVERRDGELRLAHERDDTDDERRAQEPEWVEELIPMNASLRRFAIEHGDRICLRPRLVDRAVVVRPEVPLSLPPKHRVSLFVSSPLTVEVELDDVAIAELSVSDPPQTWFGPSTTNGEICYASRTSGRRHRADLPARPVRAFTELKLENKSLQTMDIERVRLPVPRLELAYDTKQEQLVTAALRLTRSMDNQGEIEIESLASGLESVSPARIPSENRLKHAFAALWS